MHPFTRLPLVGIEIPSYGFMMMVGFMIGIAWATRLARKAGLDPNDILDLSILLVFGGVLGSRVFYYVQYYSSHFATLPWYEVFRLDKGGLVWYGGLLTDIPVSVVFLRWRGLDVGHVIDLLTPPMTIGLSCGRIGCFLNGCCWGRVAPAGWRAPLALVFPVGSPAWVQQVEDFLGFPLRAETSTSLVQSLPPEFREGCKPVYATQLYEWAGCVLLAFALAWVYRHRTRVGQAFWGFWVGYGALRFSLEFLRNDETPVFGTPFHISQLLSFLAVPAALAVLAFLHLRGRPAPAWDAAAAGEAARAKSGSRGKKAGGGKAAEPKVV